MLLQCSGTWTLRRPGIAGTVWDDWEDLPRWQVTWSWEQRLATLKQTMVVATEAFSAMHESLRRIEERSNNPKNPLKGTPALSELIPTPPIPATPPLEPTPSRPIDLRVVWPSPPKVFDGNQEEGQAFQILVHYI